MTPEQFKEKAALVSRSNLEEIDQICWEWLRTAAESNGREGEVALSLIDIIQAKLMP